MPRLAPLWGRPFAGYNSILGTVSVAHGSFFFVPVGTSSNKFIWNIGNIEINALLVYISGGEIGITMTTAPVSDWGGFVRSEDNWKINRRRTAAVGRGSVERPNHNFRSWTFFMSTVLVKRSCF